MVGKRFGISGRPDDFTYELNRATTPLSKCAGLITDIELVHSWYNVDDHNEFLYFLERFGQYTGFPDTGLLHYVQRFH